jgi:hypothetical protein
VCLGCYILTCSTLGPYLMRCVCGRQSFSLQPRTFIKAEVNAAQVHAGAGIIFCRAGPGSEFAKLNLSNA